MKPSAFLTLLNCSSFMVLVLSLSFTCRHEAPLISMAQARNGRPFMPTCGQVFARRGVVVGAPDAGSVDFDECVDGVAPIGHLVAVIVDLPSSALWAVPLTVRQMTHYSRAVPPTPCCPGGRPVRQLCRRAVVPKRSLWTPGTKPNPSLTGYLVLSCHHPRSARVRLLTTDDSDGAPASVGVPSHDHLSVSFRPFLQVLTRILQGTIPTVEPLQGADLWEVHMGANEPPSYHLGKGELRDTIG